MSLAKKAWKFKGIWTPAGWLPDATIEVDGSGRITQIATKNSKSNSDAELVEGWCIPSLVNGHSHAFQFAMAGTTETRGNPAEGDANDSFWSWRESMYHVAGNITPAAQMAIAARAYSQMAKQGIQHVAEFHYLHHPIGAKGDSSLNTDMAEAIMDGAELAGIHLTLVPIYYQLGGFGKSAQPRQRRFLFRDTDHYFRYCEQLTSVASGKAHVTLGRGVHSLRAAAPQDIRTIMLDATSKKLPFHIHIAEQELEVQECQAYLKARPVEWLLGEMPVDERVSLVHATHMTDAEMRGIVAAKATVVICPSTEANLGDGIFPLSKYLAARGTWAIGTDSNTRTSAFGELELLEYSQRLLERRRLVATTERRDVGEQLWESARLGGLRSVGAPASPPWSVGDYFAASIFDTHHPSLATVGCENAISSAIFAPDPTHLLGVLSGKEWLCAAGKHRHEQKILQAYRDTVRSVLSFD